MTLIAGIDEVGRGAVAGPVAAGACIVTIELFRRKRAFPCWSPFETKQNDDVLIADSKLLSPEQREVSYEWLVRNCAFGVGMVSAAVVDEKGILFATNAAMIAALDHLSLLSVPTELIIDGRDRFQFPIPHRSIIRGDQTEPAIAAASIIAKVTRDRWMRDQEVQFPNYGFSKHKGYGSADHYASLRKHGPCPLHRRTFLRSVLV
jgi:ribonuclease HII